MERSVFGGVFIKGPGEKPLCEGDVKEAGSEPGGFWVRTWEMHGFGTTEGSGNSNQKAWLGRASTAGLRAATQKGEMRQPGGEASWSL